VEKSRDLTKLIYVNIVLIAIVAIIYHMKPLMTYNYIILFIINIIRLTTRLVTHSGNYIKIETHYTIV